MTNMRADEWLTKRIADEWLTKDEYARRRMADVTHVPDLRPAGDVRAQREARPVQRKSPRGASS